MAILFTEKIYTDICIQIILESKIMKSRIVRGSCPPLAVYLLRGQASQTVFKLFPVPTSSTPTKDVVFNGEHNSASEQSANYSTFSFLN